MARKRGTEDRIETTEKRTNRIKEHIVWEETGVSSLLMRMWCHWEKGRPVQSWCPTAITPHSFCLLPKEFLTQPLPLSSASLSITPASPWCWHARNSWICHVISRYPFSPTLLLVWNSLYRLCSNPPFHPLNAAHLSGVSWASLLPDAPILTGRSSWNVPWCGCALVHLPAFCIKCENSASWCSLPPTPNNVQNVTAQEVANECPVN